MSTHIFSSRDAIISAEAVTPSDTAEQNFDAIFVGTAGDLAVQCIKDSAPVTFKNLANGTFLRVNVAKVLDTGTDADDIVGCQMGK